MKNLLFIFSMLVLMVACDKDDENGNDTLPIKGLELPSSTTPIKQGATVTIKGEGFTQASEIWFRTIVTRAESSEDVKATVKEVTATGISFVAPAVYGNQSVLLKENGKEYSLGEMTFEVESSVSKNLYVFRRYKDPEHDYQLVKLDPITGEESVVANLDIQSSYYTDLIYLSSSDEIIGFDEKRLIKVNIKSGISSVVPLQGNGDDYESLVKNEQEELFTYQRTYSGGKYLKQLVKIDKNTGKTTLVADIEMEGTYYEDLVYFASTKEVIGLIEEDKKLLKINTNTGKSQVIDIKESGSYEKLVLDNNGNLYAKRENNSKEELVKINPENGAIEILLALPESEIGGNLIYHVTTNEIMGIHTPDPIYGTDNSRTYKPSILMKINLDTKAITKVTLSESATGKYYDYDCLVTD